MRDAYLRVTKEMDAVKQDYERKLQDMAEEVARLKMVV
jgi:hypothetical protein